VFATSQLVVDPAVKDVSEIVANIGGLTAVVLAGFGIIREVRKNREERQRATELRAEDLRWRRANAAWQLLTDIHKNPFAPGAVEMLDWCDASRTYRLPHGEMETLDLSDVMHALDTTEQRTPTETYVVDCFDWFLYYVDRLEHYIQNRLILFEDVADTMRPYVRTLVSRNVPIDALIKTRGYRQVHAFLNRYADVERHAHVQPGSAPLNSPSAR
jgi:hypothetical protein